MNSGRLPAKLILACTCGCLLLVILGPSFVSAQSADWEKAAGGKMAFDVTSVRQNASGIDPRNPRMMQGFDVQTCSGVPIVCDTRYARQNADPNGLLRGVNQPLYFYIGFAYKLDVSQTRAVVAQMPPWAQKTGFDIEGRAQGVTTDQRRLMMQSLLADRFRLAAHFETKDGPAYALVLTRAGKLGSQMRTFPDGFPCSVSGPGAPATIDHGRLPASCGDMHTLTTLNERGERGISRRAGRNVSMDDLLEWISLNGNLDRPLVDRTGLRGTFDVSLTPAPPDADAAPEPPGAAFLQDVNAQLGLKVQSITAPVRSLIIDHIEEPTPN